MGCQPLHLLWEILQVVWYKWWNGWISLEYHTSLSQSDSRTINNYCMYVYRCMYVLYVYMYNSESWSKTSCYYKEGIKNNENQTQKNTYSHFIILPSFYIFWYFHSRNKLLIERYHLVCETVHQDFMIMLSDFHLLGKCIRILQLSF